MNENAPNPVPNAVPIQLTIGGAAGFEPPQFQVIAARLTMGISDCFELKLDVQHLDPAIHLGSLLRREVVVQFPEEAHVPELRGIIRRARSVTSEPTGISRYQLRIVPPLWLLHPRRNHRIFPGYVVTEILDCLLGEHGVTDLPSRSKLSDPHPYRPYTVQYGESDLEFVQRVMADEGIVYWFDFKKGKTELVLADDTSEGATALDVRFPFVPLNQLDPNRSAIYAMAPAVDTTWAASTIRDYDYLHPSFEIVGKGAAPPTAGDADLEWYEFEVGEVRTAEQAKKRAADTLASHYNRDRWMVCDSTVLLAPGTKFGIDGSARPEANGDFLVCWTLSYWDAGKDSGPYQYEHHLTCIPAVNKFKTRRLSKPSIAGVQTGVVLGREGMERDLGALRRFEGLLQAFCPQLRWAGTEKVETRPRAMFARANGQSSPIESLSDSERMAVLFAGAIDGLDLANGLVLIDAPELWQHPGDHARFFDAVAAAVPTAQVLSATTSAGILRALPREQVVVLGESGGSPAVLRSAGVR